MTEWVAFDAEFYRSQYRDLRELSDETALQHYLRHGMSEGRQGSQAGLREHFVKLIPSDCPVLEIGPFDAPVAIGPNVQYTDVLSTDGLRARAREIGRNPDGCPTIHYILKDLNLGLISDSFGAVVSSHCIEHQPDLIHHLQAIERILEPDGRYFLLIPDKRYCFDHFLPESSIADVITAHIERRQVHSVCSVIEHWALTAHNDPLRHWAGDHGTPPLRLDQIRHAIEAYSASPSNYIDVHAWQFTPCSFAELTNTIADLGYTNLRPLSVFPTPRPRVEFCAILGRRT